MSINIALVKSSKPSLPYQKLSIYNDCIYGANRNGIVYKYNANFEIVASHDDWVNDMIQIDDKLYTASKDNSILCNNIPFGYHTANVCKLFNDNNTLISASTDGNIAFWKEKVQWIKTDLKLTSFDYIDKKLLISTIDGKVVLFDTQSMESSTIISSKDMVQHVFQISEIIYVLSGSVVSVYDARNSKQILNKIEFNHRITSYHICKDDNILFGLHNGNIYNKKEELIASLKSPVLSITADATTVYASCIYSSDIHCVRNKEITLLPGFDGISNAQFSNDKTKILYKTVSQKYISWDMITHEVFQSDKELDMGCNFLAACCQLIVKCGNLILSFSEDKLHNSEIYFEDMSPTQFKMAQKTIQIDRVNIGAWYLLSFFRNQIEKSRRHTQQIQSPSAAKIKQSVRNSPRSPPTSPFFLKSPKSASFNESPLLTDNSRSQSEPLFKSLSNWPFEVKYIPFLDYPIHIGQFHLKSFSKEFGTSCHSINENNLPKWITNLFILECMPSCVVSKLSVFVIPFSPNLPRLTEKSKLTAHRYLKLYKVINYIKESTKCQQDLELIINGRIVPESSTICSAYFLFAKDIANTQFKQIDVPEDTETYTKQDVCLYYRVRVAKITT